jgi:hypothetical protein
MALQTKVKRRLKGAGMQIRSRFKLAKASASKFNFTSARKMALKKAQEASAKARKLSTNKSARTLAVKGAKMKIRSKFKQSKAGQATIKATSSARKTIKAKTKGVNKVSITAKARGLQYQALGIAQQTKKKAIKTATAIRDKRKATKIGQTGGRKVSIGTNSRSNSYNFSGSNPYSPKSAIKAGNYKTTSKAFSTPRRFNVGKAQNNPTSQLQVGARTKNRAQSARMSRSLVSAGMTNLGGTKQGASKNKAYRSPILENVRQNLMYGGKFQSRILERARKAYTGYK